MQTKRKRAEEAKRQAPPAKKTVDQDGCPFDQIFFVPHVIGSRFRKLNRESLEKIYIDDREVLMNVPPAEQSVRVFLSVKPLYKLVVLPPPDILSKFEFFERYVHNTICPLAGKCSIIVHPPLPPHMHDHLQWEHKNDRRRAEPAAASSSSQQNDEHEDFAPLGLRLILFVSLVSNHPSDLFP
jgi:hypothetical protein